MSKLEHLKMIERLKADEHYSIAEEIAYDQDNDDYVSTMYYEDKKIKNYITDILVKETDSTFLDYFRFVKEM